MILGQNDDDDVLVFVIDKSEFREYPRNSIIELKEGGILFEGKLKKEEEKEGGQEQVFKELSLIPALAQDYQTLSEVKLLKFFLPKNENMESIAKSSNRSLQRDSFSNMVMVEQDIERKFVVLQKKLRELERGGN